MTFPNNMRDYLLRLDEKTWRQIRAQVRWAYAKASFLPPRRLARFVRVTMPPDPKVWQKYAAEITLTRRHIRLEKMTERRKVTTLKRQKSRRAWLRDYMREYRDGLRRRTA